MDIGRVPESSKTRKLGLETVRSQSARDYVDTSEMFRSAARDNIAAAQSRQRHYANKSRDLKRSFQKDDLVLLMAEGLDCLKRSKLPTKWRPKYLGPLRVLAVMGPVTYRIELPPGAPRAHDVFHVS